ncbi:MAG: DMT family transporter [Chloroflexi bacterium]|nr:DMT family transporter [Chloroflexota bacterium]
MEYDMQQTPEVLPIPAISVAKKSSRVFVAIGAAVLSAACWGAATVMTKGSLDHVPPFTLVVIQLISSVVFLWLVVFWRGQQVFFHWRVVKPALSGLLEPGLAATFGTLGLALTTASSTTLIITSEPIVTLTLAWLILQERVGLRVIALALAALAGVIQVTLPDSTTGNYTSLLGNLLVFLGVLCASLYTIATRRAAVNLDPLPLCALQQLVALIWSLIVLAVVFVTSTGELGLLKLTPGVLLLAVASGVVGYGFTFWLFLIALRSLPAGIASLFLMLIPVFGVAGAYIFLNERLMLAQLAGGGLILAALAVISRLHQHSEIV